MKESERKVYEVNLGILDCFFVDLIKIVLKEMRVNQKSSFYGADLAVVVDLFHIVVVVTAVIDDNTKKKKMMKMKWKN